MNVDWQTSLSLAVVAIAAAVLLRNAVQFVIHPQSRGCSTCPSNNASSRVKDLPLVQLSKPQSVRSKDHSDELS